MTIFDIIAIGFTIIFVILVLWRESHPIQPVHYCAWCRQWFDARWRFIPLHKISAAHFLKTRSDGVCSECAEKFLETEKAK